MQLGQQLAGSGRPWCRSGCCRRRPAARPWRPRGSGPGPPARRRGRRWAAAASPPARRPRRPARPSAAPPARRRRPTPGMTREPGRSRRDGGRDDLGPLLGGERLVLAERAVGHHAVAAARRPATRTCSAYAVDSRCRARVSRRSGSAVATRMPCQASVVPTAADPTPADRRLCWCAPCAPARRPARTRDKGGRVRRTGDEPMSTRDRTGMDRRTLLRGAAALAAVPLAAACTGPDKPTPGPDGATPAPSAALAPPLGLTFPPNFVWGAATSAYQVEGAAAEDGRGPSIWDTFSHTPGRIAQRRHRRRRADHYHRYGDDVDLMRSLGLAQLPVLGLLVADPARPAPARSTRRAWTSTSARRRAARARHRADGDAVPLGPAAGAAGPRAAGRTATARSGSPTTPTVVFEALGDAVPTWLTINEPKTIVDVGYRYGAHAPGRARRRRRPTWPRTTCCSAHGLAVQALRADRGRRAGSAPR